MDSSIDDNRLRGSEVDGRSGQSRIEDETAERSLPRRRNSDVAHQTDKDFVAGWHEYLQVAGLFDTKRPKVPSGAFGPLSFHDANHLTLKQSPERTLFRRAISQLSPEHATVIRLRSLAGMSCVNVGDEMGQSPEEARALWIQAVFTLGERFRVLNGELKGSMSFNDRTHPST